VSLFAPSAALGRPYWWDDAPPDPPLATDLPERADVLVIGAGYTGLAAALTVADAGASVVVVDAGRPGAGASGRNGGMFGAHPRLPFETVARRFGREVAAGIYAEAPEAFAFTRGLIDREAIDCDFRVTGRIQLAWTRAHFKAQKRLVSAVTAVAPVTMEIVERADLEAEIATGRYFGAIRFPDHGAIDPARFHDGLLRAVLRRGVPVAGGSSLTALERGRSGFVATAGRHDVTAETVILATNGYTEGPFGWARRRVFPLPSYIVATEPLDPDCLRALAPGGRMMVETRARHSYFRLSPDGSRILFGGRAAMVPIPPDTAAARLHATMTEIWPSLAGVRLTHSWSGFTGYSFGHLPHVGMREGVHYALGYSGSGTALAPYLGMKAAWQALGDPRGHTAYARTTLATRPFHPTGRPWFLSLADRWYRHAVDPRENAAAERDRRAVADAAAS
jgi:glycine/D-amino acid oxidase-like deaminating enzyme